MSDPSAFRVRPAAAGDAPVIADFNLRLAHESEGLALDPPTVRAGVEALLADPAKGAYFVAEEGGRPVGQLMLTTEWSDWRNGPIYWLQSVYVVAERRGSGVFRALWEQALATARAAGARAVRLYVDEQNEAAQDVYRRVGMERSAYLVFERQPV
ncbi:MAG TPA: GNAT family N-acetyltransferase [Thermoanaerobaculia bacterium]|jgi:ribosomal protein S18 acetylase RimI-like enzyme|nr:GNAT family N-acetyltransferase [Thermoanaerobaculia bacterium]